MLNEAVHLVVNSVINGQYLVYYLLHPVKISRHKILIVSDAL
jgi:hypothetical protein